MFTYIVYIVYVNDQLQKTFLRLCEAKLFYNSFARECKVKLIKEENGNQRVLYVS
jgi:hypothetical protein